MNKIYNFFHSTCHISHNFSRHIVYFVRGILCIDGGENTWQKQCLCLTNGNLKEPFAWYAPITKYIIPFYTLMLCFHLYY